MAPRAPKPEPSPWVEQLRAKLTLLRKLAPDHASFRFAKPLSLTKLAAFERDHEIALPEDYREVLVHIGDGGGGPDNGIAPLRVWTIDALPRVEVTIRSTSGDVEAAAGTGDRPELPRPAALQRPFPLARAWSVEAEPPPFADDVSPYDGCLELSDLGCGYFSFLVVHGPRRGEVWIDTSAAMVEGKIEPLAPSFRAWFEAWVDEWLVHTLAEQIQASFDAWLQRPSKPARSRRHADILRWQDCFVVRSEQPLTVLQRAKLALYLERIDEFDGLLRQASELGLADSLLEPLSRVRHREVYALAEGRDLAGLHEAARSQIPSIRRAVASNQVTPAELLLALARDASPEVRRAVALNHATPPAVLRDLVEGVIATWQTEQPTERGEDLLRVLDTVARRSPDAPVDADDGLSAVRRRIAGLDEGPLGPWAVRAAILSGAMSPSELERLAGHPSPVIRHAVALASSTAASVVAQLARDADATVREAVASRPDLATALLDGLADDPSAQVRRSVAGHPQTPAPALHRLVLDLRHEHSVIYALAARPLPDALAQLHASHPSAITATSTFGLWPYYGRRGMRALPLDASFAQVRELGIYSHPSYPEPLLAPHIPEQYNIGGYEMGLHPWLSPALMDALSRNEYAYTRARVAARADVPIEILTRVARDDEPLARAGAAQNPRLPAASWAALADDPVADVRRGAVANPAAPVDALVRLADDPDPWVRRAVLQHPNAPADAVTQLGAAPEPDVRKWAPLAPALPEEALARLLADAHEGVRKAAQWRQRREQLLRGLA